MLSSDTTQLVTGAHGGFLTSPPLQELGITTPRQEEPINFAFSPPMETRGGLPLPLHVMRNYLLHGPTPSFPTKYFAIADRNVENFDRSAIEQTLSELFGRKISLDFLLRATRVSIPGYHLARLSLKRVPSGVCIDGLIETTTGKIAGRFSVIITDPPQTGPWIAKGLDFNSHEKFSSHQKQGVGRHYLQKFLAFLQIIGAQGVDIPATDSGPYVWLHIGCTPLNVTVLETLKRHLLSYCQSLPSLAWTPQDEARIQRLYHGWEIANFTFAGQPVGQRFLTSANPLTSVPTRFWLHEDYPGWNYLFKS